MPGQLNTAIRRSVLLVEDEVMIRMMVADMLEELGYAGGQAPTARPLAPLPEPKLAW